MNVLDPRELVNPDCNVCVEYANDAAEVDAAEGSRVDLERAADRIVTGYNKHVALMHPDSMATDGHPYADIRTLENIHGRRVQIVLGITYTESDVRKMYTIAGHTIDSTIRMDAMEWFDGHGYETDRIAFLTDPQYLGQNSWNVLVRIFPKGGAVMRFVRDMLAACALSLLIMVTTVTILWLVTH